jgi:hypothetical protein
VFMFRIASVVGEAAAGLVSTRGYEDRKGEE